MDKREELSRGPSRVIHLHDDHSEFDREFWRTVPPARRFEMVWEMVLESLAWRGQETLNRDFRDLSVYRDERRGR